MVAALGEVTGATMMCIYLSGNIYDFHGAVWASRKKFEHYEKKQVLNKFKKEGLVRFQDQAGYDEWLIVKVNDKSQTSMSSDPATDVGAIKREFKKVGKNKKHSKNLVTAFIDAVAA